LSRWQDGSRDFSALVRLYLDARPDPDAQIDQEAVRAILGNADLLAMVIEGAVLMTGVLFKLQKEGIINEPGEILADYARMISSDTDEAP
jgi:hypothetical protein